MTQGKNRRWKVAFLFALALLMGIAWLIVIPPPLNGKSKWSNFHPDEVSHISVARYMASHRLSLPPYASPYDTSVHPPLYHGLAGIVFTAAATVLSESGALQAMRLFGVLIGLGTIWYSYRAASQVRLSRSVAFPAAFLVASVPMRMSLSGAVTNENLAALGAAATLAFLYENIRFGFAGRRFVALVFWCVVAVGCKITCAGLLLSIGVGLLYSRKWRGEPLRVPISRFAFLIGVIGAAWGWWFAYNIVHFGDPLRKAAADRMWDPIQPGYAVISITKGFTPLRYFVSIVGAGWVSFWGCFDGMTHRFPLLNYLVLFVFQIAAFVGAAFSLRRVLPRSRVERAICVVTGVFAAWVFLVYCQYNWAHYPPQGRYFFVLLAPFGVLMAGGMNAFLRRFVPSQRWRQGVWLLVALLLLYLNLYALRVMPTDRIIFRNTANIGA
ncbi:MAG: hypothetical protein H8F28_23400 [Fibrella sp.]|nr:hypothetical protein [Armatimonadota bacterium]